MVLQLTDVEGIDSLQPEWVRNPPAAVSPPAPVIRSYSPAVERYRNTAWEEMPANIKARPDAAVQLDKFLHVMTYESGGGNESALAPGSDGATGVMRIQNIAGRPSPDKLLDPRTNIRTAWNLIAPDPDNWHDYNQDRNVAEVNGKPTVWGALGAHPYSSDGGAQPIGTVGSLASDGYSYSPVTPQFGAAPAWDAVDRVRAREADVQQQSDQARFGQIGPPNVGETGLANDYGQIAAGEAGMQPDYGLQPTTGTLAGREDTQAPVGSLRARLIGQPDLPGDVVTTRQRGTETSDSPLTLASRISDTRVPILSPAAEAVQGVVGDVARPVARMGASQLAGGALADALYKAGVDPFGALSARDEALNKVGQAGGTVAEGLVPTTLGGFAAAAVTGDVANAGEALGRGGAAVRGAAERAAVRGLEGDAARAPESVGLRGVSSQLGGTPIIGRENPLSAVAGASEDAPFWRAAPKTPAAASAPTPAPTPTPTPGTFSTGSKVDVLLGIKRPEPKLSKADEAVNVLKDITGLGVKEEPVATTTMRERARVKQVAESQSNRVASVVGDSQRAFDLDKTGRIKDLPGEPTIQDLAARLPEYADQLSDAQKAALETMKREIDPWAEAWKEAGLPAMGSRADVVDGGFYIPRGSPTAEGTADAPLVMAKPRKAGGRAGFEKSATYDSMTAGIENGEKYPALPDAIRDYVRGSGNRIIDNATANAFKDSGLGVTEAQRMEAIAPGLSDEVGTLRSQIHQKLETLVRQTTRSGSETQATERLNRLLEATEARVSKAIDKADSATNGTPSMLRAEAELRTLDNEANRVSGYLQAASETGAGTTGRIKQTQQDINELRDALDGLTGRYKEAQKQAAGTPRGSGRIGFNAIQGMTFPEEVANAANKFLQAEGPTTGRGAGIIKAVDAVNNLLRGLRATGDVSFMGIQGLLGAAHSPESYGKALTTALKSMGQPEAFGSFIKGFDAKAVDEGVLSSADWARNGLHIGGRDTEYTLGRGITDKLRNAPVLQQSDRAFGVFGDTLRLELANTMMAEGRNAEEVAKAANLMTGWSAKTFGGDIGGLTEFAPRFFQSQLELLTNAATSGGRTGTEARKSLTKLIGLGTMITVGANAALGNQGYDYMSPLSKSGGLNSNFMRIRVAGQDVSLFGPWDSLLRGIVATGHGDLTYMARTKASPAVQLAWDAITGKTFTGKDFTPEEFLRGLLPFSVNQIGDQPVASTLLGLTGLKSSPMTPSEQRDTAAFDATGQHYDDLFPKDKAAFLASDPGKTAISGMATSDYQAANARRLEPIIAREKQAEDALSTGINTRKISAVWHDEGIARRTVAEGLQDQFASTFAGFDKTKYQAALEKYYAAGSDKTLPDGQPDFDAMAAARSDTLASLPPDQREWVTQAIQVSEEKKSPLHQEYDTYIAAKKQAGYFKDGITQAERTALDRAHPDLDVGSWKFGSVGGKSGGALASLQAVDTALASPDAKVREITYAGMARPVNADPDTIAAWKSFGNRIDWYLNDLVPQNREAEAKRRYQKSWDQLNDSQRGTVTGAIHDAAKRDPLLEAQLVWAGVGGADKKYTISKAGEVELQKLWQQYKKAPAVAKDGWTVQRAQ